MSLLGYHGPILSRLRGAPPLGPRLLSLPTHQGLDRSEAHASTGYGG
jgi:hypothetical protein